MRRCRAVGGSFIFAEERFQRLGGKGYAHTRMGVDGYVVGAAAGVEISVKERAVGAVLGQVGKAVDDAGQL